MIYSGERERMEGGSMVGVWGGIVLLIFPLPISEDGILTSGPQTPKHNYCWFVLVPNENGDKRKGA